jgi:integrative and conjugative element protein (TIGR02256 family)
MLMRSSLIWLSSTALERIAADAQRFDPLETGGILIGYRLSETEAVITRVTSAGPLAVHRPRRFLPDPAHDEREIARIYCETSGRETYLGDWHTHPGQRLAVMSGRDHAALKTIVSAREARVPNALTLIAAGERSCWSPFVWSGHLVPRLRFWTQLVVSRCELQVFDSRAGRRCDLPVDP